MDQKFASEDRFFLSGRRAPQPRQKISPLKKAEQRRAEKKRYYLLLLALLCLLLLLSLWADERLSVESPELHVETQAPAASTLETSVAPFPVYVSGAVKAAGVYYFEPGDLVEDAIVRAGGLSLDPAEVRLNLAAPLTPHQHIHVASFEEALQALPTDGTQTDKVSLNFADQDQLMSIPGIGEKTAQSILALRREKGRLESLDDLLEVPGIKDKKLTQIAPYLTLP